MTGPSRMSDVAFGTAPTRSRFNAKICGCGTGRRGRQGGHSILSLEPNALSGWPVSIALSAACPVRLGARKVAPSSVPAAAKRTSLDVLRFASRRKAAFTVSAHLTAIVDRSIADVRASIRLNLTSGDRLSPGCRHRWQAGWGLADFGRAARDRALSRHGRCGRCPSAEPSAARSRWPENRSLARAPRRRENPSGWAEDAIE
jgi:hypothetical protein